MIAAPIFKKSTRGYPTKGTPYFLAWCACALLILLLTSPVLAQHNQGHGDMTDTAVDFSEFDEREALDYSRDAIGRELKAHILTSSDGTPIDLDQFRGKPLIISMIYTSCYHTCPMITQSLARSVDAAKDTFGPDAFSVISVGFDVEVDTVQRMASFAKSHGLDDTNWTMLSTDKETIESLAANLGFIFYASSKGFDHLAQTTIIDSDGIVFRQVYGESFDIPRMMEPMKQLIFGHESAPSMSIEGLLDRVRLFCTIYDPKQDRYRFDYSLFLSIFLGVLCLGFIAVTLVREWIKTSRRIR